MLAQMRLTGAQFLFEMQQRAKRRHQHRFFDDRYPAVADLHAVDVVGRPAMAEAGAGQHFGGGNEAAQEGIGAGGLLQTGQSLFRHGAQRRHQVGLGLVGQIRIHHGQAGGGLLVL